MRHKSPIMHNLHAGCSSAPGNGSERNQTWQHRGNQAGQTHSDLLQLPQDAQTLHTTSSRAPQSSLIPKGMGMLCPAPPQRGLSTGSQPSNPRPLLFALFFKPQSRSLTFFWWCNTHHLLVAASLGQRQTLTQAPDFSSGLAAWSRSPFGLHRPQLPWAPIQRQTSPPRVLQAGLRNSCCSSLTGRAQSLAREGWEEADEDCVLPCHKQGKAGCGHGRQRSAWCQLLGWVFPWGSLQAWCHGAEHEVSRQGRHIYRSPAGATVPGLGAQCQESPWRARSEHPSAAVFIQGFT